MFLRFLPFFRDIMKDVQQERAEFSLEEGEVSLEEGVCDAFSLDMVRAREDKDVMWNFAVVTTDQREDGLPVGYHRYRNLRFWMQYALDNRLDRMLSWCVGTAELNLKRSPIHGLTIPARTPFAALVNRAHGVVNPVSRPSSLLVSDATIQTAREFLLRSAHIDNIEAFHTFLDLILCTFRHQDGPQRSRGESPQRFVVTWTNARAEFLVGLAKALRMGGRVEHSLCFMDYSLTQSRGWTDDSLRVVLKALGQEDDAYVANCVRLLGRHCLFSDYYWSPLDETVLAAILREDDPAFPDDLCGSGRSKSSLSLWYLVATIAFQKGFWRLADKARRLIDENDWVSWDLTLGRPIKTALEIVETSDDQRAQVSIPFSDDGFQF